MIKSRNWRLLVILGALVLVLWVVSWVGGGEPPGITLLLIGVSNLFLGLSMRP